MGKSASLETDFLKQIFNGTHPIPNWSASGGTTSIWLSLHTADPTVLGSTVSEGGYAQYLRILLDRSTSTLGSVVTSGSSVASASASPLQTLSFPQNLATSTGTFTYAGVWASSIATGSSIAGSIPMIYSGTITPSIAFSQNVTPQLTTASVITES